MNCYSAFGLIVSSVIELRGFAPAMAEPDVAISFGKVPESLPDILHKGVLFQAAHGKFLLSINDVARYLVLSGKEIIIEPAPGAQLRDIEIFLTSSAFGALLFQRGIYAFHGSALQYNDSGIIISGRSGAGKSTLTAVLLKRNLQLITDDLCAIYKNSDLYPVILPGTRYIKLWQDSMNKLDISLVDKVKVRENIEKYILPVTAIVTEPVKVSAVFVLQVRNTKEIEVEEIKGFAKLNLLRSNTFRYQFVKGLDITQIHFEAMSLVGRNARIFKLYRPQNGFSAEELADALIGTLET